MPHLDWIGKKAVVNHHREVPYRLLHCDKEKSFGDPEAGNLLVQGDNLEALKALLPYYAGQVKCIYIDPPYNTGNESWVYNDNVNSPEIRAWLGKVVGKEAEDLSRHDKWLCMMYPRLRLLKEFLREDGIIFVSIDDHELHTLRFILNEIFGSHSYLGTFVWRRRTGSMDESGNFSRDHEYILTYQRGNGGLFGENRTFEKYSNPDADPRGDWLADNLSAAKPGGDTFYAIKNPETGQEFWPPKGRFWPYNPKKMQEKIADGRIIFPNRESGTPLIKRFKNEAKSTKKPISSWIISQKERNSLNDDNIMNLSSPMNTEATKKIKEIFGDKVFNFSKPFELIEKLIECSTQDGDYVLDSFSGSGSTGQAILNLNSRFKGTRKFILVELDSIIADQITSKRLEKVIGGYELAEFRTGKARVEGIGGGFRYCTLGAPLFDPEGDINEAVSFRDLAAHVFFCETGSPIPRRASGPLIGTFQDRAIYLLYAKDSPGVANARAGNVLNGAMLADLPEPKKGTALRVVYAEGCTLSETRLRKEGVIFKHIPYQITGA